ncbi:cell division protein FtsZ homolog 2-1, chloroplastic-like [Rosa chinensis]|uniref:cell division protein FtsZ homolog 2-1, chloroplastic-like n=1 Tax=Rosa chinensis TaxID=74649 RepID=UPI001AD93B23|nr:cell division protein FtsZ homolog 2-1, chloroplastic-like [Rosa chinensis]
MHIGRIRDIKTLENDIQIKVRVCRLWRFKRFKPIMKNDGLQFILFDEMENQNIKLARVIEMKLIVIPNDKLLTAVSQSTPVTEAFNLANDILPQGVSGVSDIITIPGLVNVDFADVRVIMANAESEASLMILDMIVLEPNYYSAFHDDITVANLVKITVVNDIKNFSVYGVNAAAEVIYYLVDPTANLIFGAVTDPSLSGQVGITLIASGFKRKKKVMGGHSMYSS